MDKSLKKLSRVELLELMVQLSEDNEALVAENAQLKQAIAQQPQLPRSARIGSIAEAALQANGFFAAAQRSADEYLREVKRMRDQMAARAGADGAAARPAPAASGSSDAVQDAQARAQLILKRANEQAEAIVSDARKRSDEAVADANRRSHAILSRANRQADAVLAAARAGAAQDQAQSRPTSQSRVQQGSPSRVQQAGTAGRGRHARVAGA